MISVYIKKKLRKCTIVQWYLECKKRRESKILESLRLPFIPQLAAIVDRDTSIISSNCFAGRIMQDLHMQYNSPTLGLYFWYPDYIEFLRHLKYYLTEAKLTFVEHSKYALGDKRRKEWKHWYPIGLLDGKVEIAFLHYTSEEDAAEKWYRRASRVNWDNILVIGMEQNSCTEEDIKAFDSLPIDNKIFFSSKKLPGVNSNVYMEEFQREGEVGDPYRKAHLFYRYLVNNIRK